LNPRRHRHARLAAAAAGLLVLLSASRTVAANHDDDEVLDKRMRFIESGSNLLLRTSVTEIFDAEAYDKLETGLESVLVIRLYVYKEGQRDPVAYQLLRRRVVYDLWDDEYLVGLDGPSGRRDVKVKTQADALKLMTELERVPIAALDDISLEDHHFLGVVVELNPVSSESLAEMRRWLTHRASSTGSLEGGSSFFGSFVSVFVNPKIAAADRIIRLRSQNFYRPAQR
jgi:hypothetical protein